MQIRPHDAPYQRQPAAGGSEEAQHGEAGIAEDPEGGFDPHQHRRPHDEGGEDQPQRDAFATFWKPSIRTFSSIASMPTCSELLAARSMILLTRPGRCWTKSFSSRTVSRKWPGDRTFSIRCRVISAA